MARQHPYKGAHMVIGNYDSERYCEHTPAETYTRYPCSCGRELWPPRGRGRGESLLSPRRIAAKLTAIEAMKLHIQGVSYARIARSLGYRTPSGAWRAVQRIRDNEAAWRRYEAEGGTVGMRWRHRPTHAEMQRALEELTHELETGGLDGERLERTTERLRRLLTDHARGSCKTIPDTPTRAYRRGESATSCHMAVCPHRIGVIR
jgi:hypothetical protein